MATAYAIRSSARFYVFHFHRIPMHQNQYPRVAVNQDLVYPILKAGNEISQESRSPTVPFGRALFILRTPYYRRPEDLSKIARPRSRISRQA